MTSINPKIKLIGIMGICTLLVFSLTGCSNQKNNSNDLKPKLNQEIKYVDTKIISLMNSLNNISFTNYKVESTEIGTPEKKDGKSSESGGSSDNSSEKTNSGEQSSNVSNENQKVMAITSNAVLSNDRNMIDWKALKLEIEILYQAWTTITIDLHSANVDNNDILSFNSYLDQAMIASNKEDKNATLVHLANMYAMIPKYISNFSEDNNKKQIFLTKSNVLSAYALVEVDNWNEIIRFLSQANETFGTILNSTNINENTRQNIDRAYILLKELEKTANDKDKDLFFVKYKSAMQELNNL